jgi:hypothetical protein
MTELTNEQIYARTKKRLKEITIIEALKGINKIDILIKKNRLKQKIRELELCKQHKKIIGRYIVKK